MRNISDRLPPLGIPEERPLLRRLPTLAWGLPVCAVLLALVGLSVVRSASTELAIDYLPRQAAWVVGGIGAMVLGFAVNHATLLRFALPIYTGGVAALVLVRVFGHEAGGARSWIGIGGFGGQPSDVMKLAVILVLVRYLAASDADRLRGRELLVAAGMIALPAALIALEPDLGGAVILLPALAALVWLAGLRLRVVAGALVALLLLGAAGWVFALQDYQRDRIRTFFSPQADPLGAGYQIRQSKIAVGSGELLGKGYMQGTQSQLRFLPARHTDFAFAVLAEERGFVGVVVVLALYLCYLWSGVRVASRARDRPAIFLTVGLLAVMSFHILYNTAMTIGFVPITGIPLPFLSYGGSFTLWSFFVTGLMLGVDFRRWVNR
ncbi:MAG TPA: rod shape-determining protein RodA [Thermoanaerobaculia bacterium]|nr:rod shape-determining protein RodA [Thermoanaerobaculia bacterium]